MSVRVYINGITGGTEPYNIYICQPDNTSCFYIATIEDTNLPYEFDIPEPYDNSPAYLLKMIDTKGCIISGTTTV